MKSTLTRARTFNRILTRLSPEKFYSECMPFFDTCLRLILAAILGGVLGLERQKKRISAGLRTHMLVSTGAALLMLISMDMLSLVAQAPGFDPARIGGAVVSGIGFLCAGAIIKDRKGSYGITTAGSIWMSAAIGLAVGSGYYAGAFTATAISFVTLFLVKKIEPHADES